MIYIKEEKLARLALLEKILDMELFEHSTTQLKTAEEKEFNYNPLNEHFSLNGKDYGIQNHIFIRSMEKLESDNFVEIISLCEDNALSVMDDDEVHIYTAETIIKFPTTYRSKIDNDKICMCSFVVNDLSMVKAEISNLKEMGVSLEAIEETSETKELKQPYFNKEKSVLFFHNKEILISKNKNSKQHYFLEVVFKDKQHAWNYLDIADELGDDDFNKGARESYWQAFNAVNEKIACETKIKDFLSLTMNTVAINKKYLS